MISVAKIPVGDACRFGDICDDNNARCMQGICTCVTGFFAKTKACCESHRFHCHVCNVITLRLKLHPVSGNYYLMFSLYHINQVILVDGQQPMHVKHVYPMKYYKPVQLVKDISDKGFQNF